MGDQLAPAQEPAVFSDFYKQWAPRALGSLARLQDLSDLLDEEQREGARSHAREELLGVVYPGQLPPPPRHGAIDDYDLPALFLAPGFDASTVHARFLRFAWARFPLIRTILARARWLCEPWDALQRQPHARVLVVQPGPAAELTEVQLLGGRRVEVTLLETDARARRIREPSWRERWPGRDDDLCVGVRPPTGLPATLAEQPPFDLVYGAGVLGGLADADARALVRSLFRLLAPQGRLVLGNLRTEAATSWLLDYVLGWPLRYREPEALRALAEVVEDKGARIEVLLDPTERASLLEVTR